MTRIFVLRTAWLTDEIISLLHRLLGALGFDFVVVEAEECGEFEPPLMPEDVLLVLIDGLLDQEPRACEAIRQVSASGARVVGVWPPGSADGTVPTVLERRSAGLTTCDQKAFDRLLRSPDDAVWLDPDGSIRDSQPLKRGGC